MTDEGLDEGEVPVSGGYEPTGRQWPRESDDAGPASLLLSGGIYYTDDELVRALRNRLVELELQAGELEAEVLAAQERLGVLLKEARARAEEAEGALVAALVPGARQRAAEILEDARQRASELGLPGGLPLELGDLGQLLIMHFELEEQLVQLITEVLENTGPGGRA